MSRDTKIIAITITLGVVLLAIGLYFTIANYQTLFHQETIIGHAINPIRENCIAGGGKYVTGSIGGYPSFFCIPA
jgi:hypothetical protein